MMLVQKQPPSHFSLSSPYHHRRHPSAPPAVVVQPTRTPGLLSLSKPPKPSPQRHPGPRSTAKSTPKAKPAAAAPNRSPQPPAAVASHVLLKPSVQAPEKSVVVPSPEKSHSRGRQAKPAKDKTTATRTRSASHSSTNRSRRNNTRQPSPPTQSSQAEGPTTPTFPHKPTNASNLFDPFLDDSPAAPRSTKPVRAAPTLSARPSGKLARRRQPVIPSFPTTPTKSSPVPVPIPQRKNAPETMLSRSDPVLSHTPKLLKRSSMPWDAFPICDDMTDAGDLDLDHDLDVPTTPVTPTRPRTTRNKYDDGPRTAPLSTTGFGFPFAANTTPSPTPPPRNLTAQGRPRRTHKRNPSEGVFHMSSDEESSQGQSSRELKMLFGLVPSGRAGSAPAPSVRGESTPARNTASPSAARRAEREAEREAAEKAAGYFASSMFQNSPNPEELPPPLFA